MACNCKNPGAQSLCCSGNNTCEKTCVDVKKVFDACIQQYNDKLTLTTQEQFATITSIAGSGSPTVSSLEISPIPGSPNSRVTCTVTSPITINGTNATGTAITETISTDFDLDIIMRVPQDGVISPQIETNVAITGLQNTITEGTTIVTNACITIIVKVIANVILVIPSYGYPTLPPCQEYTQDICNGLFGTPIFPQ